MIFIYQSVSHTKYIKKEQPLENAKTQRRQQSQQKQTHIEMYLIVQHIDITINSNRSK